VRVFFCGLVSADFSLGCLVLSRTTHTKNPTKKNKTHTKRVWNLYNFWGTPNLKIGSVIIHQMVISVLHDAIFEPYQSESFFFFPFASFERGFGLKKKEQRTKMIIKNKQQTTNNNKKTEFKNQNNESVKHTQTSNNESNKREKMGQEESTRGGRKKCVFALSVRKKE